jgi:hypothetical protein
MKPFKHFLLEQSGTTIGFFPGAFKPPHKGHFDTAKQAATTNGVAVVLVSSIDREGITSDDSFQIWNLYKPFLPKNLYIYTIQGSPVLNIYQIIDILNNGKFTATQKILAPLPRAKEIADNLLGLATPYKINLYSSEEDKDRFNAFHGPSKNIYTGKSVSEIDIKGVSRLTSSTAVRAALKSNKQKTFMNFLPNIPENIKLEIFKRLKK